MESIVGMRTAATALLAAAAMTAGVSALGAGGRGVVVDPPCGAVQTDNVLLTADMSCTGSDGIVVGASGITIDLNGRTVDGDDSATEGVRNDGFEGVVIKNGVVTDFETGIAIIGDARGNRVEGVEARSNVDGFFAIGAGQLTIRSSQAVDNSDDGFEFDTVDALVLERVYATSNGGEGIALDDVTGARISESHVAHSGPTTFHNGLLVQGASTGIVVTRSSFSRNGDAGIRLQGGTGTQLKEVRVSSNVQDGVHITAATGTAMKKLTADGNTTGVCACSPSADGTTLSKSVLSGNTVGFDVAFPDVEGVVVSKTTALGNQGDGLRSEGSDTAFKGNSAFANGARGIVATVTASDGGGNQARGNAVAQCVNLVCP